MTVPRPDGRQTDSSSTAASSARTETVLERRHHNRRCSDAAPPPSHLTATDTLMWIPKLMSMFEFMTGVIDPFHLFYPKRVWTLQCSLYMYTLNACF